LSKLNSTDVENLLSDSKAPRITDKHIDSVIKGETFAHRLTGTLTVCILTLANGFTVVGKSACASPENYNEDLGEHYAREDAKRQIWPLEAYLLREKLALADRAVVPPSVSMQRYVGSKVVNARPMSRGAYVSLRGWELPADENAMDDGYLIEYADRFDENVPGFLGYISWSPADVFERAYGRI